MSLELIQKIIEVIIALVIVGITTYVVPFIRTKLSSDELATLKQYITFAVGCAEMYFTTEEGKKKKEYVTNYVKKILSSLSNIEVTDEQLDVMIEGIVYEVKYGNKATTE